MRAGRFFKLVGRTVASPWALFLVAFLLRIVVIHQLLVNGPERIYTQNEPSRIAWAVVSGYGYSSPWPRTPLQPTAQQPPLYPL